MAEKKIPMRMCVGCRQMKPKRDLIRVVLTKEGEIKVDVTGRMNGRGAYLCRSSECLDLALKNHGLEKSLHMRISEEIMHNLKEEMN